MLVEDRNFGTAKPPEDAMQAPGSGYDLLMCHKKALVIRRCFKAHQASPSQLGGWKHGFLWVWASLGSGSHVSSMAGESRQAQAPCTCSK